MDKDFRFHRAAARILAPPAVAFAIACSSGSSGGPIAPNGPTGDLAIGLAHSPGSAHLIARATITVAGRDYSVRDGEVVTARDLAAGEHRVFAEAVHPDCAIEEDVRTIQLEAGSTVRVDFSITCRFVSAERIVYNTLDLLGHSSDVFSVRPDGSDRRRLTDQAPGLGFPAWSPDGTRVLYEDFVAGGLRQIWIVNYDGTQATRVGDGGRPAWAPDGRKIAFELNGDLAIADFDGSRITNVVMLTNDSGGIDDEGPSWSPDGSMIAFHRDHVIHLVGTDGSGLRALEPGVGAVWTPDGTRIFFARGSTGLRQIASMKVDGTDVRVLTNQGGGAGHPDLSPNGDRIVFHSPTSSQSRIWIMNADGSDPQVIGPIPVRAEHPNWGPP